MSNGRVRRTRRQVDPYAVYDALPAPIRAALQEGPQQWDAVWCRTMLRRYAKRLPVAEAIQATAKLISRAHLAEIEQARPWQAKRFVKANRIPSPHMLANATMQTSGRPL